MECIGSVDQGTQSTRFFLYDKDCTVIASSQIPVAQIFPKQGWVDQDPMAIWESVQKAISETMRQAQEKYGEGKVTVKAVGITNQRETTIVWDKITGKPLCNAIVWLDNRTSAVAEKMAAERGGRDAFRAITGLPTSTYFSAYKLKWLLDNKPDVAKVASEGRCMFGTVDTWLLYNFTGGAASGENGSATADGVHVTDVSNASRTNLMDISTLKWHKETIDIFGASKIIFPEIKSNAEEYGNISATAIPELAGVPIAGCLGDQQAAMMGQRCQEKEAKNTYGTGCFMLLHTGTTAVESKHGLLTTVAYQLGPDAAPNYALEGSIAIAGQGITWLRDSLGLINDSAESEALAESVPNCGGVFFVPAFGGLLAPWWEPDARGIILGLTQHTTKAHIVRAMLEAISFQTRDVLEAMRKDSELNLACLFVDGGACKNNALMQMQTDILQVPVRRPFHMETTSLGAALAAGIAVGFWTLEEAFADAKHSDGGDLFEPKIDAELADKRHGRWKKAVERSMQLAEITAAEEEGGV
jgi:glycerol kinase